MPLVSFIIPLFNHLAHSRAMLKTLQATMPKGLAHEIILIDDGSTDGTREWLASLKEPHIKTLHNPHNLGYAKANNKAVSVATGEVLALVNNDLLFTPGWLEPMLDTLLSPTLNACVVGNLQYRVDDGKLDHAGLLLEPGAQYGHIQTLAEDAPVHTKALAVTGACMLLRKADFDALGGFDEAFENGGEDLDLCFKVRAAGKSIYVANKSRIQHHVSLSRGTATLRNVRNSRLIVCRWRSHIKQDLVSVWVLLLRSGPQAYAKWIDGELSPAFLATPHTAALVIAEAMLQREELSWVHQLGEPDPNADIAQHCTANKGLHFLAAHDGYAWRQGASFVFEGLRSARNFYVAGRSLVDCTKRPIAITIRVNSLQQQTVLLTEAFNFNVGIAYPILLQGKSNRFHLEAHFVDAQGVPVADASASLVIAHFVVDDHVLADLENSATNRKSI